MTLRRRELLVLLGGAAATWPIAARGQQAGMPVIGFLYSGSPDPNAHRVSAFLQGLRGAGYVQGQNVSIEYRWSESQDDRLSALVAELIQRKVAVIVAGPRAYRVAKSATATIPIIFMTGNDPVRSGLVTSLSHPGGNLTGVAQVAHDLEAKRIGLLRELVPQATKIAALLDPNILEAQVALQELEAAGRSIGLPIQVVRVGSERDFDAAFAAIVRERAGALIVTLSNFFSNFRNQLVALNAHHRVPAMYSQREFTEVGGLISYGPNVSEVWRQVGLYAGRILRGEKPADLPVVLPTKYETVLNLKTAKTLGLTVPNSMQLLADEVIE